MADQEKKPSFKSGFISLIGRPNSGKSTLLNLLLGEKIAITSPKPQTTRNRILGIKNLPYAQMIFLDTPGIHRSKSILNQSMVRTALSTLQEVDSICFLVEADFPDNEENEWILENLKKVTQPVFLVINKIDIVSKGNLLPIMDRYSRAHSFEQIIPVSALLGEGVDVLVKELLNVLPDGPRLFPEDMITDLPERFLAAELIREKVFHLTRDEVPYATAVSVEEFQERPDGNLVVIRATIRVERESQKGILIGEKGRMLKEIGRLARQEIETLLGTKVFLELWVKVEKNWREDPQALRRLGFQ
ncbi:MAG: GTPase Era [Syntrophaceae bacterium]|nr:GTPase Era [Syntrophaceae bacterium]